MNDDINIQISQFEFKLKDLLQETDLPIGVVYYIIKDLYIQTEKNYYATINTFLIEDQEKIKETLTQQPNKE